MRSDVLGMDKDIIMHVRSQTWPTEVTLEAFHSDWPELRFIEPRPCWPSTGMQQVCSHGQRHRQPEGRQAGSHSTGQRTSAGLKSWLLQTRDQQGGYGNPLGLPSEMGEGFGKGSS